MKNASSTSSRGWRHTFAIFTLAVLIALGAVFGLALPCGGRPVNQALAPIPGLRNSLAGVSLRAQPSGRLVVQSTEQVFDTKGIPWQVMVYKYPEGIAPQLLMLGLKADQPTPAALNQAVLKIQPRNGKAIEISPHPQRASLDQGASAFQVQYDLTMAWAAIEEAEAITLTLLPRSASPVTIPISTQLLQEWHTVASCQALLCNAIDRFTLFSFYAKM
jgi:hypothetical protein